MKKYIHSCFIGIGIASFIIVLNSISYFGINVVISSLVLGVFQGIIVPLIYHNKIKTLYLVKVLLHAIISYLLIILWWIVGENSSLSMVSLLWFIVFISVFSYFHFMNHKDAYKINTKLKDEKSKKMKIKEKA